MRYSTLRRLSPGEDTLRFWLQLSPRRLPQGHSLFTNSLCSQENNVTRLGRGPASRLCSAEQSIAPAFKSSRRVCRHPASWAQMKKRPKAFFHLCPGEDLNLHGLLHYHLKVARLPITPPGQTLSPTSSVATDSLYARLYLFSTFSFSGLARKD